MGGMKPAAGCCRLAPALHSRAACTGRFPGSKLNCNPHPSRWNLHSRKVSGAASPFQGYPSSRVSTASWRRDAGSSSSAFWDIRAHLKVFLDDMHAHLRLAAVLVLGALLGARAQLPIPFCDVTCQQCSAAIKVGTW